MEFTNASQNVIKEVARIVIIRSNVLVIVEMRKRKFSVSKKTSIRLIMLAIRNARKC